MSRARREMYAARDHLIWPYEGDCIDAIELFIRAYDAALVQVEREREELGI